MVKVDDMVRFLNDVGGGRVVRLEGNLVIVEDEDGFERPVQAREVVVVGQAGTKASAYERPLKFSSKLVEPDVPAPKVATPTPVEVFETEEGEVLNVVLAFQPKELKHLHTTTFYAILVNDSNYFLQVTYMSRSDDDNAWHTRYSGLVEPNMQIDLEEFGHNDLNTIEHVAIQYIAFKQDKGFRLKNPALVEQKLDLTKFYKLHSFHESEYFDEPVISIPITRNDLPARQLHIDSSALERAMKEKRAADRPQHRRVERHTKKKNDIIVQDLHIAELLDNLSGLSHTDMLNVQLDKFREVIEANKRKIGQKIVFIHGKGEGVLRRALLEELKKKWPQFDVQDASFQEYGFGATQITIRKIN